MKLRYLFILLISFYLCGCGQTGPLYPPPPKTSIKPNATPANKTPSKNTSSEPQ